MAWNELRATMNEKMNFNIHQIYFDPKQVRLLDPAFQFRYHSYLAESFGSSG